MATPAHQHPAAAPPRCPVCGAGRGAGDEVCAGCGLVFASLGPELPGAPAARALARGRYAVQRVLSHGGMGAIYLAVDQDVFDRPVVLKAMLDYFDPADPAEAAAARERFQSEARTLADLRHPAIPQIYSYFAEAGRHYIVMEYIAGRDLDAALSRAGEDGAPLARGAAYPLERVLRWGVSLCKVLEYLASRRPHPGVHHDIKPANLILDEESGELRLVDFGTARSRLRAQAGRAGASGLFGTQGYAPPEQYRGESEPRSDVYALAATLYHLATDDDPSAHPFRFPRLEALGELGLALAPALDRDVARRPAAAELRAALERLLAGPSARPLQAPDGRLLDDLPALVAWCEDAWEEAVAWLHADLPDQIAVRRGETSLAAQLYAARERHPSRHLALDAALAALDPDGYGAAAPGLELGVDAIDFGRLRAGEARTHTLRVRNGGRRCLVARLELPAWIWIDHGQLGASLGWRELLRQADPPRPLARRGAPRPLHRLALPPGWDVGLPVRAEVDRPRLFGKLTAELTLTPEGGASPRAVSVTARTTGAIGFLARVLASMLLGAGAILVGMVIIGVFFLILLNTGLL